MLFTACGGGGGGGGGSASNASGTTWGGKTTITIPFGGGTGRASVSEGFKKLGCTSIDLTVTQTANGTSEVIYEETISPDEDVTIEVITGSKIDAVATLIIQDKDPRTATGSIDRVAVGKNTLTLYVEYTYALMDNDDTVFESDKYTSRDGLLLPSFYEDPYDNPIFIVNRFIDSEDPTKTYDPGRRHDITGDVTFIADAPLYFYDSGGDGIYKINYNAADGTLTSATIPAYVDDKKIYGFHDAAFKGNTYIERVVIENGIESIDTSAFEGCTNLTSVSIPATVTQIGNSAFYASGLTSVNLPSRLTSIESNAFAACDYLGGRITIPGGVTSIGESAFEACGTYSESPMQVVIEHGVRLIGICAFGGSNVSSVTLPEDLETIGNYAFSGTNISSITIPNSVTTIGSYALADCAQLQEVYMPVYDLTHIDLSSIFTRCTNLTDIYLTTDTPPTGGFDTTTLNSLTTFHYPSTGNSSDWASACSGYTVVSY